MYYFNVFEFLAFWMLGHSTRGRISSAPAHELLRQPVNVSIPVRGLWSRNRSGSKGEAVKTALVKMKLKELREVLQQRELRFLINTLSSTMNQQDWYPDRKEFTTERNAFTFCIVTFCCIVYYPICATSRLWKSDISQLKRLQFLPTPTLLLIKAWCSG